MDAMLLTPEKSMWNAFRKRCELSLAVACALRYEGVHHMALSSTHTDQFRRVTTVRSASLC